MTTDDRRRLRLSLRILTEKDGEWALDSHDLHLLGLDPYQQPPPALIRDRAREVVYDAIVGYNTIVDGKTED